MHASNDIRKIKCLDGLRLAFELVEYNYRDLHNNCCELQKNQDYFVIVLSQCWSIIDNIHRIREISQTIPGLSKSNENRKKFLANSKITEDYRHYIQHLRKELQKKEVNPFPVWGTISWVDNKNNKKVYTAILGTPIKDVSTSHAGCVYDTVEGRWVSNVTLNISNYSLNFDPIIESVRIFKEFIITWILETYEPGINQTLEIPIISMIVE